MYNFIDIFFFSQKNAPLAKFHPALKSYLDLLWMNVVFILYKFVLLVLVYLVYPPFPTYVFAYVCACMCAHLCAQVLARVTKAICRWQDLGLVL